MDIDETKHKDPIDDDSLHPRGVSNDDVVDAEPTPLAMPSVAEGHMLAARAEALMERDKLFEAMQNHVGASAAFLRASEETTADVVKACLIHYSETHKLQSENIRLRLASVKSAKQEGAEVPRTRNVAESFMVVDANSGTSRSNSMKRRRSIRQAEDPEMKRDVEELRRKLASSVAEVASLQASLLARTQEMEQTVIQKDKEIAKRDRHLYQLRIALAQQVTGNWNGSPETLDLPVQARWSIDSVRKLLPTLPWTRRNVAADASKDTPNAANAPVLSKPPGSPLTAGRGRERERDTEHLGERERDREAEPERDQRGRERGRGRDREREREQEREREPELERERGRERERAREKERIREREREQERERERERQQQREREQEREREYQRERRNKVADVTPMDEMDVDTNSSHSSPADAEKDEERDNFDRDPRSAERETSENDARNSGTNISGVSVNARSDISSGSIHLSNSVQSVLNKSHGGEDLSSEAIELLRMQNELLRQ